MSLGLLHSVMIAGAHGAIERGFLSDGVLLLIEKLRGESVDMYVPPGAAVLVGLHGAVLCSPAEVPGVVGVQPRLSSFRVAGL